jgi:hypothetical protein
MSRGGLSEARLGRMHDVMAGYVGHGEAPGFVTLVARRGEVHADEIGTKAIGHTVRTSWFFEQEERPR